MRTRFDSNNKTANTLIYFCWHPFSNLDARVLFEGGRLTLDLIFQANVFVTLFSSCRLFHFHSLFPHKGRYLPDHSYDNVSLLTS